MNKKLLDKFVSNVKTLPEPIGGYYHGTSSTEVILPENIIIVGRHEKHLPTDRDIVHHRFLLAVNLTGEGSAIIDSVRFHLNTDQCVLIFPHQYHHFFWKQKDICWIFITFEFAYPELIEKIRNKTMKMTKNALRYLELLTKDYKGSYNTTTGETTRIMLLTKLLLNELITHCCDHVEDYIEESCSTHFVDKVNQYIYANMQKTISISELAEKFSYSTSRFRAIYKETMGIPIGQYIKEMRLHKAQSYLGTTDMTITEIAETCGYESLYSFSHAFKNYIGSSPANYRKIIYK